MLTFDDGYVNNLHAWEILSAARIPFVIFVCTGAVGTPRSIWTAELSLLLLHGRSREVELLGRRWPLAHRGQRVTAFHTIRRSLKRLPAAGRRAAMAALSRQFPLGETARLLEAYPAFRMLTWRQLEQLAAGGVTIGSHGVDHELHHSLQPATVRARELRQSRATLERRLHRSCRAFAFPNGDLTAGSAEELHVAGYALGFTIEPGVVGSRANPYLLPRLKLAATGPTLLSDVASGRGRPIVR
jgi:peptidoglycan/xylan/chitin deacetylase (PgdA/CDA1 family)